MNLVGLIGLLVLSDFFGIYAMVLELKGLIPYDQLLFCLIFGVLAFLRVDFSRFKYESDCVFQVLFLIRK